MKPQHKKASKEGIKMTTDTLLTPTEVWSAKIYSNGWKKPGLGTADVTEKATGAKLGEIGIDVGTRVRGQKDHRPGKVLRYLDPAERDVFLELEKERTVVGMHRGVHGARSDGVHANVLRSHVLSRRPRKRMQGGLRRAIVHSAAVLVENGLRVIRPGVPPIGSVLRSGRTPG